MSDLLRTRVLPWVVWLAVMGAAMWLWRGLEAGEARGFVEDAPLVVAAPSAGRIETIAVVPGQRVAAGDIVATLDSREIDAELEILTAEARRLEAELGAVASETQVRVGETSRGIEESLAAAERALQVARADRGVRAAELAAMTSQLDVLQGLVDKQMSDRRELDALKVKHAALKKEIAVADASIAQLVSQASAARARRTGLPADAAERATDPLREGLAVLRQRERLLTLRKESLTLRAPADGEVALLHLRPGEVAAAGALVATLTPSAAAAGGAPIFVCLDEPTAALVRTGEAVLLQPPTGGAAIPAHVQRLSPHVTQLPPRCWRDAKIPEWGRAAYVELDDPTPVVPGQAFAVAFLGELSPRAGDRPAPPVPSAALDQAPLASVTPATPAAPSAPHPLTIPPTLLARTRLEPSGVTWSSRLDRLVVVSDDTGLSGQTEHVPWLFTMDVRGRFDPEPLVIAGIDELRDLEAIAPAPDGGLYVLASQSRSRKGKRNPARQRFVHVALGTSGARADGVALLTRALERSGADARAALGLTDLDELDIEGMSATAAGGLLIGLKAPLGPRGEALIWHLARPDELLASGELAGAGLGLWGSVPLHVVADGVRVPGGISELLELSDGTLLIATTASGLDPAQQDGALVHVRGRDQLATPRTIRTFPGLKPEGLALAGAALVVLFDHEPPQWMELPWPAL